ncbi:hypothetical protein Gpo141_00013538 [Globisporangium polare]
MWNVCRVAALHQLRRSAATSANSSSRGALAIASNAATSLRNGSNVAPTLARHFTNIAGVDREFLLSRSAKELRTELGNAQIVRVQQALGKELENVIAQEEVTPEEVKDLFVAAQKTKAASVMLRAFEFMQHEFPHKIDFAMFGEVFRIMMKAREGEKMFAVYEEAKARFQTTPEMIYRFGIVGKLEQGDLEAARAIWDEMLAAGHETPNEVSSRMLMAYARAGERELVLELFESIDPQIGQWHESAIDRVILSLGVINEPQKAFEFYINSSMKLNGGTLIALLSVCVNNNCHQQAVDILANRKRFDLQLDARAYNRILTTLEFLGHHSEILEVLEEMRANNVRFDTMTRIVIQRNLEHLEGSSFAEDLQQHDAAAKEKRANAQSNKKQSSYFAAPKIRELVEQKDGAAAVELVSEFVKPLLEEDVPEGTKFVKGSLKVPPSLAKDAVRAYILTGEHKKVKQLLQTFSTLEGNYGHALAEIMVHYGRAGPDKNEDMAYAATKALLFQGRQIFRVDDALALFRKFKDVESTSKLFTQVITEFAANKQASANGTAKIEQEEGTGKQNKRFSQFNIGRVINMTLQTFVENRKLPQALEALELLDKHGLQPNSFNYAVVFNTMRDQNSAAARKGNNNNKNNKGNNNSKAAQVVYSADQFELVWEGMRRRNVIVNKSIVGNVCAGFASGNKRQRLMLLEAYAETRVVDADKYVLPTNCFNILLQLTAHEDSLEEVKSLFEDAIASLGASPNGRVPRDWVTTVVASLNAHGEAGAAHELFLQMEQKCGNYSYEALISALRAATSVSDKAKTAQLVEILEEHKFRLNLTDAYEFVHIARDTNQPQLALEVLRLFEASHVNEAGTAFRGLNSADARSSTKLRTMYRVTLNVCEQNGQWKNALRLRERVVALLGEDVLADSKSASGKKSAGGVAVEETEDVSESAEPVGEEARK